MASSFNPSPPAFDSGAFDSGAFTLDGFDLGAAAFGPSASNLGALGGFDLSAAAFGPGVFDDQDEQGTFTMYNHGPRNFIIQSDPDTVNITFLDPVQAPRDGSTPVDPRAYMRVYARVLAYFDAHQSINMLPYKNMLAHGDGYQTPVQLHVVVNGQPSGVMVLPAIHFRNAFKFTFSYRTATLATLAQALNTAEEAVAALDRLKADEAAKYDQVQADWVRAGLGAACVAYPRAAHMVRRGPDGVVGKRLEVNTAAGAFQFPVGAHWGGKPVGRAAGIMEAVHRRLAPRGDNAESKRGESKEDDGCLSDEEEEEEEDDDCYDGVPQTTSGKQWPF